ncbi:hypothetical protein [Vibrio parahaemolyticus]|uniref:hypothetical protein n=1 Tax=Vibrio parahaemolyticus TaxID=670 RepID=UPI00387B4254
MSWNKPLVIINCSDSKKNGTLKPLDLYNCKNTLANIIKSFSDSLDEWSKDLFPGYRGYIPPRIEDVIEVVIISAKHGLLLGGGDKIEPYDLQMPSTEKGLDEYVKKHKRQARATINALSIDKRPVYVCLTNRYKKAFFAMCGTQLSKVNNLYISEDHRGIGELRGRLNKVCKKIAKDFIYSSPYYRCYRNHPIVFTSGASCAQEMEVYTASGSLSNIGTSLHYVNSHKNSKGAAFIKEVLKKHSGSTIKGHIFYDNGFVSNQNLDLKWVLREYNDFIDTIKTERHKLTIVLPDDLNPERAIEILESNKDEITALLDKWVRVVLPIHDVVTIKGIKSHASKMLQVLGWHPNITAGIPCLADRKYSLSKVEAILSLKNPDGKQAFEGVHFFGLGKTEKRIKAFNSRLTIAQLYDMKTISYDANRANALWGNKAKNNRPGTKIETLLEEQLALPPAARSSFVSVSADYDIELVKDFYLNKIDLDNYLIATSLINDVLPKILKIDIYHNQVLSDEIVQRSVRAKLSSLNSYHWSKISHNIIHKLHDFNLINYRAIESINYFDKRKIVYSKLIQH